MQQKSNYYHVNLAPVGSTNNPIYPEWPMELCKQTQEKYLCHFPPISILVQQQSVWDSIERNLHIHRSPCREQQAFTLALSSEMWWCVPVPELIPQMQGVTYYPTFFDALKSAVRVNDCNGIVDSHGLDSAPVSDYPQCTDGYKFFKLFCTFLNFVHWWRRIALLSTFPHTHLMKWAVVHSCLCHNKSISP